MSNFVKILIICTIGLTADVMSRPHCQVSEASADECGERLMFIGQQSTGLPKSDAEMKTRCDNVNEGLQCLKKYSKTCLDPFATQIMNIVMKNGDKMEAKYCKDDGERKKLLDAFMCAKDADLGPLHLCMEKFIVQMEHLPQVNGDHRIPATCCSFQLMDKCVKETSQHVCTQKDKVEYMTKFLTEMTGELIKTGCGRFDSLSHCDNAMDKTEWQNLKNLVASDDPKEIAAKRVNTSPFVALKSVLKNLMEE
ncbi:unnamed protein product [Medioppia subpectinata]|uniref:Uncharacterized protein n=1 Tax=Medioppia subpectinata TaxID=1979941 RepID=A0A7R9Q857_9ACAR|nr:unnamed protein product [Medioppia subpectinata]CAG2116314.1 unnamed protein product [Medioppia subpectinata]